MTTDDPWWLWSRASGMSIEEWMELNPCSCQVRCHCDKEIS